MKKLFGKCLFSLTVIAACSCIAFADTNAFTPLNFEGNSQEKFTAPEEMTVGNDKMQSAINHLDNAQVDVRNELLNTKTKYSDIDAQYNAIKAERKAVAKQVKKQEKKIKQLDKTKEKIRKNMI